jgi:phytoene dehydrogenase-like protein
MQSTNDGEVRPGLIVVGGGLAGLFTAALVAQTGRKVVVLERSSRPGGRAMTLVERGIHFNLGPHALYCRGLAYQLLKELEIPFTGGFPNARRGCLTDGDRSYAIPRGVGSALASRLLSIGEKVNFLRLVAGLPRLDARGFDRVSFDDWIGQAAGTGNLARLVRMLTRVSTYIDDRDRLSAGAAIDQLKQALSGGVWYLDGGWQTLVDGLRARLLQQGVELRTGVRVRSVGVEDDGVAVELATGDVLQSGTAVLAIDPPGAIDLLGLPDDAPLARWAADCIPVRAACLDVALSHLPLPQQCVAFALDRPLYFSVHSASAELAPTGVAVLHVMKYLGASRERPAEEVESELEAYLERLQPGWRAHVVARQFLPGLTVAHSTPRADESGLSGRPAGQVDGQPNVFLAGDWVGPHGMLADASAASAREAARRVVAALSARSIRVGGSVSHATA